MNNKKFHEILKELRTERGLTQSALAELIDNSRSAYSLYELGQREPDFKTVQKMADFFGVTVDYLLGRAEHPNVFSTDDLHPEGVKYFRKLKNLSPESQKKFIDAFEAHTKLIEEFEDKNKDK